MQAVRHALGREAVGDRVEREMWCSWCFTLSSFVVAATATTGRNVLRCRNCSRSGARCRICNFPSISSKNKKEEELSYDPEGAVARGDGQRCCVHDGTIPQSIKTFQRLRILLDVAASDAGIDVASSIALGDMLDEDSDESAGKSASASPSSDVRPPNESKKNTASLPDFTQDRAAAVRALAEFANRTGVERWCSWCFTKTRHALLTKNLVGRHVYRCTGPGCASAGQLRRTMKCIRCRVGMTRGADGIGIADGSRITSYDEETCFVCDGRLKPVSRDKSTKIVMKGGTKAQDVSFSKMTANNSDESLVQTETAAATNDISVEAGPQAGTAAKTEKDSAMCDTSDTQALALKPTTASAVAALAIDSAANPRIPVEESNVSASEQDIDSTSEGTAPLQKKAKKRPFAWGDLTQEECVHQTSRRGKWCSWCFQSCDHLFQRKSMLSGNRKTYMCLGCGERTLSCKTCSRAMTRGGAGWDDLRCAACSGDKAMKTAENIHFSSASAEASTERSKSPTETSSKEIHQEKQWMSLYQLRNAFYDKPRTREGVCAELGRASVQRDAACKAGLLRPFLLLVSMPSATRNRAACQLGWTTITQQSFGNAHLEAWEILSSSQMGLQGRCSQSWERVNPFAGKCDWYFILKRVWETAFPTEPFPKQIAERADSDDVTKDDGTLSSVEPEVEELFLANLSMLWRENLTDIQREQVASLMLAASKATPGQSTGRKDVDEIVALQERMSANAGVSRQDVLTYGISIVQSVIGVSARSMFLLAVSFSQTMIPALAPAATPVLASAATLATPLFIIGIVQLVATGIKLAAGSSEGRCIGPVSLILQQRLLLGAEGIRLEDFLRTTDDEQSFENPRQRASDSTSKRSLDDHTTRPAKSSGEEFDNNNSLAH